MKTQRMSGKVLQKAVIDLAHLHDWRVAHFASVLATRKDGTSRWRTPVQADGKGFPDLFMTKGKRAMAVEIKGDGDQLRDEQRGWLEALDTAGIRTYVWTPRDWNDGTVQKALQ